MGITFPKAKLDEASSEATPKRDIHIKLPSCGRCLEINVKRRYNVLWITVWGVFGGWVGCTEKEMADHVFDIHSSPFKSEKKKTNTKKMPGSQSKG